jgi:hypothetical protein
MLGLFSWKRRKTCLVTITIPHAPAAGALEAVAVGGALALRWPLNRSQPLAHGQLGNAMVSAVRQGVRFVVPKCISCATTDEASGLTT